MFLFKYRALSLHLSISKSKYGKASILEITRTSLSANIKGYFKGLSSPSGTLNIITFFTAGDNEYVALAPQGDEFDGIVYLYRYIEHDDDEDPELITIESDEEYEIASDGFDEWLDNLEFEELPTVE